MAKQQSFVAGSLGFVGMMLPLLYFGGLIYYFSGVGGGTLQGIIDIGLGPTVIGLAAFGLLFAIKPLYLLFRFIIGLTTGVGTTQAIVTAGREAGENPGADAFDADAAMARYLANRSAGDAGPMVDTAPAATPQRPAFGRKPT